MESDASTEMRIGLSHAFEMCSVPVAFPVSVGVRVTDCGTCSGGGGGGIVMHCTSVRISEVKERISTETGAEPMPCFGLFVMAVRKEGCLATFFWDPLDEPIDQASASLCQLCKACVAPPYVTIDLFDLCSTRVT